jgi:hypothetical protein
MKIVNHKVDFKKKIVTLELLTFQEKDRKIFKDTFKKYQQINHTITNILKGTRKTNFPDALSESIFCLEMNCGKILSATNLSGYSTSFDCFDIKRNKRIQLKCSASTGPSSFGPRSQYDEIYFMDIWNNGEINGNFKIYKLNNVDIDNVKVNKKQKLTDQQNEDRRPRFNIRAELIETLNLKPILEGKI